MSDSTPKPDSGKRVIPIQPEAPSAAQREELVSLYKKTEKI